MGSIPEDWPRAPNIPAISATSAKVPLQLSFHNEFNKGKCPRMETDFILP